MGMFDMTATAGLKEGGKFLSAGIHTAKFNSLSLGNLTSQKDGSEYNTMTISLDVDGYGEYTQNFFEPKSKERTQSQFGPNPSQAEQFMVSLRQIFDALDPAIGEKFDKDEVTVNVGGKEKHVSVKDLDFTQLVKLAAIVTAPYAGTEVEIKLVPQQNGFNAFPGFPAKINRAGALGIATRFIGHGLSLSQSEQKKIAAAQNSRPTNMAASDTSALNGVADALGIDDNSDLPF